MAKRCATEVRDGEILTEDPVRQRIPKLCLECVIVRTPVDIHRLVDTTVVFGVHNDVTEKPVRRYFNRRYGRDFENPGCFLWFCVVERAFLPYVHTEYLHIPPVRENVPCHCSVRAEPTQASYHHLIFGAFWVYRETV